MRIFSLFSRPRSEYGKRRRAEEERILVELKKKEHERKKKNIIDKENIDNTNDDISEAKE